MTDAAITHLLRTVLSKTSKDQTVNMAPLAVPKDTGKLRKHIALLCDRLAKGARLVVESSLPGKMHTLLAGPRNFRNEALPHIALIFCISRAQSDWMRTLSMLNHRSAFKTSSIDGGFLGSLLHNETHLVRSI